MHPHQARAAVVGVQPALGHHQQVLGAGRAVGVAGDGELAVPGGQGGRLPRADPRGVGSRGEVAMLAAPSGQFVDGDDAQPLALPDLQHLRGAQAHPGVVDQFTDDADRLQAGQPGEVDRGLGVAAPLQDAARAGPQRQDVPGAHE
jgi:hypothetical protein